MDAESVVDHLRQADRILIVSSEIRLGWDLTALLKSLFSTTATVLPFRDLDEIRPDIEGDPSKIVVLIEHKLSDVPDSPITDILRNDIMLTVSLVEGEAPSDELIWVNTPRSGLLAALERAISTSPPAPGIDPTADSRSSIEDDSLPDTARPPTIGRRSGRRSQGRCFSQERTFGKSLRFRDIGPSSEGRPASGIRRPPRVRMK